MKQLFSLFLLCLSVGTSVQAAPSRPPRPLVVFDLDRTLFDPAERIAAIVRDVNRPGRLSDFADPTKPYGYRFLLDPRYLAFDQPVAGAAEAVARIQKELDADVLYLSGRYREMSEATIEELRKGNFPGYGRRSHLRPRVSLQLRERSQGMPTARFKVMRLAQLAPYWKVVAIFDDSARNLQAFWDAGYRRENGVELVRMTGLSPLDPAEALPAWTCLKGFSQPADTQALEQWILKSKRCEQLTLGFRLD